MTHLRTQLIRKPRGGCLRSSLSHSETSKLHYICALTPHPPHSHTHLSQTPHDTHHTSLSHTHHTLTAPSSLTPSSIAIDRRFGHHHTLIYHTHIILTNYTYQQKAELEGPLHVLSQWIMHFPDKWEYFLNTVQKSEAVANNSPADRESEVSARHAPSRVSFIFHTCWTSLHSIHLFSPPALPCFFVLIFRSFCFLYCSCVNFGVFLLFLFSGYVGTCDRTSSLCVALFP